MLAALVLESPDLGDERAVAGVETGGCEPDPDEPRACAGRTPRPRDGVPQVEPRMQAASTWASKRAARCEFGRTSQGTGTVPAPWAGRSLLGTARRAWVPDCPTPG